MVGYLSGYWFDIVRDCKYFDWEDLNMGTKHLGYGSIQLIDVDEESLSQMYPLVAANCKAFKAAHPELAEEMYKNPAAYVEEYNKCAKDFGDRLLNGTQLFERFFELQQRIGGILMYQAVHIEFMISENKELREKLNRYENND